MNFCTLIWKGFVEKICVKSIGSHEESECDFESLITFYGCANFLRKAYSLNTLINALLWFQELAQNRRNLFFFSSLTSGFWIKILVFSLQISLNFSSFLIFAPTFSFFFFFNTTTIFETQRRIVILIDKILDQKTLPFNIFSDISFIISLLLVVIRSSNLFQS